MEVSTKNTTKSLNSVMQKPLVKKPQKNLQTQTNVCFYFFYKILLYFYNILNLLFYKENKKNPRLILSIW